MLQPIFNATNPYGFSSVWNVPAKAGLISFSFRRTADTPHAFWALIATAFGESADKTAALERNLTAREPGLQQMLDDGIIQDVMRSDGSPIRAMPGPELRGKTLAKSMRSVHFPGAERLASKNALMYDPPVNPLRAFIEDYPNGAAADASGRLLHSIDGDRLDPAARNVVGRQIVGGGDVALPREAHDALAKAGTGQDVLVEPASRLGKDSGRYRKARLTDGLSSRTIPMAQQPTHQDDSSTPSTETGLIPPPEMSWVDRAWAEATWRYRVKHMTRSQRRERAKACWFDRQASSGKIPDAIVRHD